VSRRKPPSRRVFFFFFSPLVFGDPVCIVLHEAGSLYRSPHFPLGGRPTFPLELDCLLFVGGEEAAEDQHPFIGPPIALAKPPKVSHVICALSFNTFPGQFSFCRNFRVLSSFSPPLHSPYISYFFPLEAQYTISHQLFDFFFAGEIGPAGPLRAHPFLPLFSYSPLGRPLTRRALYQKTQPKTRPNLERIGMMILFLGLLV